MDENQVRSVGLVGGGAALLVALGMALLGREPAPAPEAATPAAIETPGAPQTVTPTPSVSASAPIPSVETANAEGPPPMAVVKPDPPKAASAPQNPRLEFIIHFDTRHPLSRAQDLWLQGKHAEAVALAREILPSRAELSGLCFARFTLGADVVLTHCARVPRAQSTRTSERWLRKLRATRGVQYVDANVVVDPERR